MRLYKADLIFIFAEILFLTVSVFSAPEIIETGERYGCDVLGLNCSDQPGHVATGFIYGGHTTTGTPLKKKPKGAAACPVPDSKSDCQAPTIDGRLRGLIQRCLWRSALCHLPINGRQSLGHPCFGKSVEYLVAKQFKCVKQSSVVDVCSESVKAAASPLAITTTTTNNDIYLLSKNYPEIVASRLDCAVSLRTNPGVRLRFRSLFMDLHPRTRGAPTSSFSEETAVATACAFDYVQLTPSVGEAEGSAPRFVFFCGNDVVDFASDATTEVRFVTGPDEKHYGGFVIRVTAEDGHRDNKIPKSSAAAAASGAGDTFSHFLSVRDLVYTTTTVLLSGINVARCRDR